MIRPRLITAAFCLLLLVLLTACGFHLRNAPDLPPSMRHIYIAAPGSNNGDLLRELRRDLASDDTEVLETPIGATTTLSIIGVTNTSRPLALSRTGQPLEYRVTYQVEFSLLVLGASILEPQTVQLQRNYTYSVSNGVANEVQEQNLQKALSKDVAQFIVYRVIAAARSLPPNLAAVPVTVQVPAVATLRAPMALTQAPPVAATRPPAV